MAFKSTLLEPAIVISGSSPASGFTSKDMEFFHSLESQLKFIGIKPEQAVDVLKDYYKSNDIVVANHCAC